jgi:hypothetical protein
MKKKSGDALESKANEGFCVFEREMKKMGED